MLSPRQEAILRKVVESFLVTGQPVASRTLAADPDLDCAPSTVRYELAQLEEHGLLAHPHTSAGRMPTDAGHRYVVDRMLAEPVELVRRVELTPARRELEEALRLTTETLSEMTDLLAIASAPSFEHTTIRHVEVLTLQPSVVMVVVITSSGGVSKHVCAFDAPVDAGLLTWAGAYLNERVGGRTLGARTLQQRLADPTLSTSERAFVERLAPAFTELRAGGEDVLYVDGTSRLLGSHRFSDVAEINDLMAVLEERVALLELLRRALDERGMFVRIGGESGVPAMRSLAIVATGYGLAQRKLGTVSVIGPVAMDYAAAITSVRAVARELSRFVTDVYDSER